ncbi:hypothetical protein Dda_8240 [Drechslerella dactyloides]|uniref:Uncharacterized protein n=1 Tax=Drechslerella dactyloides TaxID=74499 RepID=A0AAD6NFB5_DREDA|nr:hypothetical protein Dda_8240 [Drechslerella dactyloides]
MSSDTALSTSGSAPSTPGPLCSVVPEAAYIATSAATQIVTSDHESFFQTLCTEGIVKPGPPTILVTPDALRLVNQFLDYLLWSILSVGKTTTLRALRPAVIEILKSRLAREAIASAEAELEEYLGDADDEDLVEGVDADEFDVDHVWRKARLRCMIYSSLGDLEEDDEDSYASSMQSASSPLEQYARMASTAVVSPAVAIFLTSILEFIGEQTLLVAGHATVARFSQARIAAAAEEGTDGSYEAVDRPSVEELDMEKVALNPVLGRMWRQWKKLLRGPAGGQIASRAPSRRDSRRQSSISTVSIQSVLESKANSMAPGLREFSTKETDPETVTQAEDHIPANIKSGLRRLASAEALLSSPLTPIPETPATADGTTTHKIPISELSLLKHDQASAIPEFPRPNSMTTLPSHPSNFIFPFSRQSKEYPLDAVTENVDEHPHRHVRANSLPLPGAFPFTAEELDFPKVPRSLKRADEDNVSTPVPEKAPELLAPQARDQDVVSIAETECTAADIDDDGGEICTLDSFVVHETAQATTPTFYKAQSVRIISTCSAPVGFEVGERKSSSTICTVRDESKNETNARNTESPIDRQAIVHSADEIGIAKTSDISIPPTALPTPVQSPIVNDKTIAELIPDVPTDGRKSTDSGAESSGSTSKDIAKQRRRRSKYYTPAPAPTAPDFFPENHSPEEVARRDEKPQVEEAKPEPAPVASADDDTASQSGRKSAREELLDMYSQDPEFDDDEPAPVKRQTKPTTRSLRVASPLGSPGLSQTSKSAHSESSESLVGRTSAERRQYPSLDLPRPTSKNRDVTTPTSNHERAGVRMWTPPATPDGAKGRYKATITKSASKGHGQSNSISSQTSAKLKNFISGRPTTADEKRQGNRGDWDNESTYSDTRTHTSKADEKERNFEQLINSGTTLQYTLTPDNVKRIDLEIASSRKGSGESGRTKTPVDRYVATSTPSNSSPPQPKRSPSQKSRPLTTIASEDHEDIVPEIPSRSPKPSQSSAANAESIKFFPPRARSSSGAMSQPPPRGASLNAINTSVRAKATPLPVAHGPVSPIDSLRSATTIRPGVIPRRPTTGSLHSSYSAPAEIRQLRSADSKSRLIARAPQPASVDSTLALIDFFKNTPPPPGSSGSSSASTSRTPYRSVMDPKFNGPSSTGSMTSIAEKSTSLSSFHSQADLIKKPEPSQRSPRILQRPQTDGGPGRKSVRIKDPYILESEDEDDGFFAPPSRKLRHEESLVDFLMNVPPPESPAPSQTSFTQQPLKKKSSAAQLIGRLRSGSRSSMKINKSTVSSPVEARQPPKLPNGNINIPPRKHTPLPVKTVMEEQFTPRAKSSGGASAMTMPASLRKMHQARDPKAHAPDSDLSGLATFLKYTDPPETPPPAVFGKDDKRALGNKKKRGVVAV